MAQTAGLLQRLTVIPGAALACAWIGPTPTNTTLLFVLRDSNASAAEGAFENSMIDALVAAQVSRREVVAIHGANDSRITSIRIDPA
jgi:hypothetical protein